jgi:quercetin dioxygenase-like cupin family protein
MQPRNPVDRAMVELPCTELQQTLAYFTDDLGFRVDAIFPADDPQIAELSGHGFALRLVRGSDAPTAKLRIVCKGISETTVSTAPNGTLIERVPAERPLELPPVKQSLVISRERGGDEGGANGAWQTGRAGMLYRDLIPDRLGGRYIASHIRIPNGGPVPDYVHFHKIRFQMIYCYKGWVRLVYEDQGEPFVMNAGDCVLQPPQIRHRVLESSDGLEVIEIGCPADHETLADHEVELPTGTLNPNRDFGGQVYAFHQSENANWAPATVPGFESRDFGFGQATGNVGVARVLRSTNTELGPSEWFQPEADLHFLFALTGSVSLVDESGKRIDLSEGDSCALPRGANYKFVDAVNLGELLEVLA